jgi:hypothetical protein
MIAHLRASRADDESCVLRLTKPILLADHWSDVGFRHVALRCLGST